MQILSTPLFRFEILNNGYPPFAKDLLYDFMTCQSCYIFLTTINDGNNTDFLLFLLLLVLYDCICSNKVSISSIKPK